MNFFLNSPFPTHQSNQNRQKNVSPCKRSFEKKCPNKIVDEQTLSPLRGKLNLIRKKTEFGIKWKKWIIFIIGFSVEFFSCAMLQQKIDTFTLPRLARPVDWISNEFSSQSSSMGNFIISLVLLPLGASSSPLGRKQAWLMIRQGSQPPMGPHNYPEGCLSCWTTKKGRLEKTLA